MRASEGEWRRGETWSCSGSERRQYLGLKTPQALPCHLARATGQYQPVPVPGVFCLCSSACRARGLTWWQAPPRDPGDEASLRQPGGMGQSRVRRLTRNWTLKDHLVWATPKPGVGSRVPEKAVVTCEHSLGIWGKVTIKPSEWKVSELRVHPGLGMGEEKRTGPAFAVPYLSFISYAQAPVRGPGYPANVAACPCPCPRPPGCLKMLSKQLLQTA